MNFLNELIRDEIKENIPNLRPPILWNDPDITKKDHKTRFSTNIFSDYDDPEIHELYQYIEQMGEELKTHNEANWKFLVQKVFKVF